MIPSMGGEAVGKFKLREIAAACESGTAIIELGTWLGAGTEHLGLGVQDSGNDVEIHGYDWFEIHGNEVDKAKAWGEDVKVDEDTLTRVKRYLSGIKANIILHKEEIGNVTWSGRPVSLYLDDACKYEKEFVNSIKIFSPYWIPGKTIVVLMDYYFHEWRPSDKGLECQKIFIEAHQECFEPIWEMKKYATKAFKYLGGLKL